MMIKTVCIMCPVGCNLSIEKIGTEIKVSGNACVRGVTYGKDEVTAPKRVVTTLVKTELGVLPCKTQGLVPKEKVFDVLTEVAKLRLKSAKFGEVIIKNVCGTGVDIAITGNYQNER